MSVSRSVLTWTDTGLNRDMKPVQYLSVSDCFLLAMRRLCCCPNSQEIIPELLPPDFQFFSFIMYLLIGNWYRSVALTLSNRYCNAFTVKHWWVIPCYSMQYIQNWRVSYWLYGYILVLNIQFINENKKTEYKYKHCLQLLRNNFNNFTVDNNT